VPHQLLDDRQRYPPHGEVAAVGVPQVVPADAALLARDARPLEGPAQRQLEQPVSKRPTILLTEHVRAAQVSLKR